mmetsp:Transcript_27549/g.32586  ORF Transcript_27549/g.32586 Transcript_27549/m.32586 type:complete len:220 (+) Transcript_27549:2329-2988(+)
MFFGSWKCKPVSFSSLLLASISKDNSPVQTSTNISETKRSKMKATVVSSRCLLCLACTTDLASSSASAFCSATNFSDSSGKVLNTNDLCSHFVICFGIFPTPFHALISLVRLFICPLSNFSPRECNICLPSLINKKFCASFTPCTIAAAIALSSAAASSTRLKCSLSSLSSLFICRYSSRRICFSHLYTARSCSSSRSMDSRSASSFAFSSCMGTARGR